MALMTFHVVDQQGLLDVWVLVKREQENRAELICGKSSHGPMPKLDVRALGMAKQRSEAFATLKRNFPHCDVS